jgi:hypothetical protein
MLMKVSIFYIGNLTGSMWASAIAVTGVCSTNLSKISLIIFYSLLAIVLALDLDYTGNLLSFIAIPLNLTLTGVVLCSYS